jgi:putative ABC transport system permease protein
VSVATMLPFNEWWIRGDFHVEGQPAPKFNVGKPKVGPSYFKTLGIPVLDGREFQIGDTATAPKVAIVSASIARRLWPNESALGRRVRVNDKGDWLTVVGVVDDVRQENLESPVQPLVYVPYQQEPGDVFLRVVTFITRTRTPQAASSRIQHAIRAVAPDLPIAGTAMMDTLVSDSMAQPRMRTMLIGSFALCALLIATLGIYGVMTYAVTQRRREIGIRMAIGAEWTDVVWLVLRRALLIVAAGAILGIAASFAVTKALTSFLFEVTPSDPLAITGVTTLLVLVALTAAWLPARRAAQTDPVEALRVE